MIVTRGNFDQVMQALSGIKLISYDCETYGLRPFHGDKIFSAIIAGEVDGEIKAFYFNWNQNEDIPFEAILGEYHQVELCQYLAQFAGRIYMANAKYDMHMCHEHWGLDFKHADIFCTEAQGRVAYNDHFEYGLAPSLERIGLAKDDAVYNWIIANKAYTTVAVEGKKATKKDLHFNLVPWTLIVPYGEADAIGTYKLGKHIESIIAADTAQQEKDLGPRTPRRVSLNESRLTKTLWRMEQGGLFIDKSYTEKAFKYEQTRNQEAKAAFERETGLPFIDSGVLFTKLFSDSDGDRFIKTEKENDSFKSDILQTFTHPASKIILDIRDSKSKSDFYTNFLKYADSKGYVHGNFRQGGTRHGRMSASDPNLQNFSNPDEDEKGTLSEYNVRGCIIPPPGYYIAAIDYKAMEYRFLLELAAINLGWLGKLGQMVLDGHDVHQATADLCAAGGHTVVRNAAKKTNFTRIYGGGKHKIAADLGIPVEAAEIIMNAIDRAAPEVAHLQATVKGLADTRGYTINWMGRRCYFPVQTSGKMAGKKALHKTLNYVISGGCADVNKIALNRVDDLLSGTRTKAFASIHDELDLYIHESERGIEGEVKDIMEKAYPHKYIPLLADVSTSDKSLAHV